MPLFGSIFAKIEGWPLQKRYFLLFRLDFFSFYSVKTSLKKNEVNWGHTTSKVKLSPFLCSIMRVLSDKKIYPVQNILFVLTIFIMRKSVKSLVYDNVQKVFKIVLKSKKFYHLTRRLVSPKQQKMHLWILAFFSVCRF